VFTFGDTSRKIQVSCTGETGRIRGEENSGDVNSHYSCEAHRGMRDEARGKRQEGGGERGIKVKGFKGHKRPFFI
jgi:hypothetical protein